MFLSFFLMTKFLLDFIFDLHLALCCGAEGGHQSGNLPDEHVSCVVSAPPTLACVTFGLLSDRNPAVETSRRFEWSSQRHARFRAASCSKLHRRESEPDEHSLEG